MAHATQIRPPKENTVVKAVLTYFQHCQQHGHPCYARKTHGSYYSEGWPDIVGCWGGRMICLELKRPGARNQASGLQLHELATWRTAGAVAAVVTSLEEARGVMRDNGIATPDPEDVKPCRRSTTVAFAASPRKT